MYVRLQTTQQRVIKVFYGNKWIQHNIKKWDTVKRLLVLYYIFNRIVYNGLQRIEIYTPYTQIGILKFIIK